MKPLRACLFFCYEKKTMQFTVLSSITKANGLTVDNGFSKYKQHFLGFCRLQPERSTVTERNNFPAC